MDNQNHFDHKPQPKESGFWKSRSGIVLIGFLAVVGFLLAYEHRVHLFTGDAMLIALLGFCIIIHLFMHGGHGSDEGGHHHDNSGPDGGRS